MSQQSFTYAAMSNNLGVKSQQKIWIWILILEALGLVSYNIDIDQVYMEIMKNNWRFIALLFKFSMSGFFSLLHVEFLLASKLSLIATFWFKYQNLYIIRKLVLLCKFRNELTADGVYSQNWKLLWTKDNWKLA